MHFKDKVIWITGSSSGIGKELALQLANQQAILILTARNEKSLFELKEQLKYTKIHVLPFDLTKETEIKSLTERAIAFEGKIDYIIQSAGVSQRSLAKETNLLVYKQLMAINFFAPLAITQAILPHFLQNNSGHTIVISSVAGLYGFPLRSGYSASKHAIKGYIESLQSEFYHTNIKFTCVFPGRIDTPISKNALVGNGEHSNVEDENNKIGMNVSICAAKIIRGIQNNKRTIYIGTLERILFYIWWFFPGLFFKISNIKGLKK